MLCSCRVRRFSRRAVRCAGTHDRSWAQTSLKKKKIFSLLFQYIELKKAFDIVVLLTQILEKSCTLCRHTWPFLDFTEKKYLVYYFQYVELKKAFDIARFLSRPQIRENICALCRNNWPFLGSDFSKEKEKKIVYYFQYVELKKAFDSALFLSRQHIREHICALCRNTCQLPWAQTSLKK